MYSCNLKYKSTKMLCRPSSFVVFHCLDRVFLNKF